MHLIEYQVKCCVEGPGSSATRNMMEELGDKKNIQVKNRVLQEAPLKSEDKEAFKECKRVRELRGLLVKLKEKC